jgi:hypothetical protein
MKIHISENTKLLLDHVGGFKLEKRGNIEIKVSVYIQEKTISILKISGKRIDGDILADWT